MKISEIEKYHQAVSKYRVLCKCGHSVLITSRDGKQLCNWCRQYVFATPELEKQYRLNEIKNKMKLED